MCVLLSPAKYLYFNLWVSERQISYFTRDENSIYVLNFVRRNGVTTFDSGETAALCAYNVNGSRWIKFPQKRDKRKTMRTEVFFYLKKTSFDCIALRFELWAQESPTTIFIAVEIKLKETKQSVSEVSFVCASIVSTHSGSHWRLTNASTSPSIRSQMQRTIFVSFSHDSTFAIFRFENADAGALTICLNQLFQIHPKEILCLSHPHKALNKSVHPSNVRSQSKTFH